jgi:hypothetical protein
MYESNDCALIAETDSSDLWPLCMFTIVFLALNNIVYGAFHLQVQ